METVMGSRGTQACIGGLDQLGIRLEERQLCLLPGLPPVVRVRYPRREVQSWLSGFP